MLKLDKQQIKIVSLAIAAFFVLGIVGVALSQSGKIYAAGASTSNIGVINHQMVASQHPDIAQFQKSMQSEMEQAEKDYQAKAASMNDKEKQEYQIQLQRRVSLKEQELLTPIMEKIDATIKEVAAAKGLTVVLDKNVVMFGGQDITEDVLKKITGK